MEKWHDLTSGIDLPRIQRTFEALFGYILTLLLDPATVDQVFWGIVSAQKMLMTIMVQIMTTMTTMTTMISDHHDHPQLAPPLLDLLGVSEEDHHFLQIDFLPAIRHNCLDCQ